MADNSVLNLVAFDFLLLISAPRGRHTGKMFGDSVVMRIHVHIELLELALFFKARLTHAAAFVHFLFDFLGDSVFKGL